MTEEELEKYLKAGEIACRVRKEVESLVKPRMKVLDLAIAIEEKIRSLGGEPAFPVNISINDVAAHYTPTPRDTLEIAENAVVKIDIGVHVDGYIADTATTIALDERYAKLVEAAREALDKALKLVKPGVRFSDVGKIIESTVKSYGYKPIYNLSGHSLDRYVIHSGEAIPNYRDMKNFGRFRSGRAYAIEPFVTDGIGFVEDSIIVTIYAIKYNPKKLRSVSDKARKLYEYIYGSRKTLPFALRWYTDILTIEELVETVNELSLNGLLIEYPVLVEKKRGIVAQAEHTVVLYGDNAYITTDSC